MPLETFTAEIAFTGICGIVPKVEYPDPPKAFCVVLPNAWKRLPDPEGMKPSLDTLSFIRRHHPFVEFSSRPHGLADDEPDLLGLWHLLQLEGNTPHGTRLVIEPQFINAAAEDAATPAWDKDDGIGGLASFEDVADDSSLLTVANAVKAPADTVVGAQVVLKHGTLKSKPGNINWIFDPYLRNRPERVFRPLSHLVVVTIGGLTSLTVRRVRFDGTTSAGDSFVFNRGPAYVTVANLCDSNPLRWGRPPASATLPDDDDFRLHYEIVDNRLGLRSALSGARCPIPRLTMHAQAGGSGFNCDPIRWPAVYFQL